MHPFEAASSVLPRRRPHVFVAFVRSGDPLRAGGRRRARARTQDDLSTSESAHATHGERRAYRPVAGHERARGEGMARLRPWTSRCSDTPGRSPRPCACPPRSGAGPLSTRARKPGARRATRATDPRRRTRRPRATPTGARPATGGRRRIPTRTRPIPVRRGSVLPPRCTPNRDVRRAGASRSGSCRNPGATSPAARTCRTSAPRAHAFPRWSIPVCATKARDAAPRAEPRRGCV
jgi:hypothetical protein